MLNCLIYTKNRACQLDAFLRSMKRHWKDWKSQANLSVIWTSSEEPFLSGYQKLFEEHPDVNFINQSVQGFKQSILTQINPLIPYTIQFVDDIVFINAFTIQCSEFESFIQEPETISLSLRMHPGITNCYMLNLATQPPLTASAGKWEWLNLPGDWGYPYSTDGHIFRTEDILPCLTNQEYNHPNALEDKMTRFIKIRPFLRCFPNAKILNIPSNKVGQNIHNRSGNLSADCLNNLYLKGHRINIEAFDSLRVNSVHYELNYQWIQK